MREREREREREKKMRNKLSFKMKTLQVLSIQQLYRISTMYWDDKYGTHSLSPDVCI